MENGNLGKEQDYNRLATDSFPHAHEFALVPFFHTHTHSTHTGTFLGLLSAYP